jgi:DNA-binding CsgD family transcriptional regulator
VSAETPARLSDGLTTGSLLRRYAVLCGYLIGLFGWVVALPLYGSVGRAWAEARGVGFASLPLWWLGGHAPALMICGMLWDRRPRAAAAGAQGAAAVGALLTLLLLWPGLPGWAWPVIFILMGAATAAGMTAWGRWYGTTVPLGGLARVFSLAAAGVSLTKWLFAALAGVLAPALLVVLTLPFLAVAMVVARHVDPAVHESRAAAVTPDWPRLRAGARLALFITFFSVVAGLSYRVLFAAPISPLADESLRRFPYIVGVLVAGALADRRNLVSVMVVGSGLLALSFLVGAWGDALAQYAGVALNGMSFGLLESAPWLLLAANATPATVGRWFGWGLNLNVLPIAIGALLPLPFGQLSPERLGLLGAVAMLMAILSLHGVVDPLEGVRREEEAVSELGLSEVAAALQPDVPPALFTAEALTASFGGETMPELLARRYGAVLSGRELEIASLAVLGISTRAVAQQLFISENTVKTHLRNIFRKTGSANRHALYRRLVAEDRGS